MLTIRLSLTGDQGLKDAASRVGDATGALLASRVAPVRSAAKRSAPRRPAR
jgi:hypothetical protein